MLCVCCGLGWKKTGITQENQQKNSPHHSQWKSMERVALNPPKAESRLQSSEQLITPVQTGKTMERPPEKPRGPYPWVLGWSSDAGQAQCTCWAQQGSWDAPTGAKPCCHSHSKPCCHLHGRIALPSTLDRFKSNQLFPAYLCIHLLGDVAVVSDFDVTQDIGQLLQHKHFDLIHRAAEFQVTQIQAGGEALLTSFVIGKYVLV